MSRVALREFIFGHSLSNRSSFHPSLKTVQKAVAAGVAGLGFVSICVWALDPGVAAELARNADNPIEFFLRQASLTSASAPQPAPAAAVAPIETRARRKERGAAKLALRSTVCVRLCDGYFFPAANAAACGALCPGAATEAFFQPSGAGGLDKAISAAGQRYTALPNAFRYQTTVDATCSCRGGEKANASALALRDPTLRRGDVVMTEIGMRVFQGGGSPRGASAFASLAKAAMPPEARSVLLAMERASAPAPVLQRAAAERAPIAARAPRRQRVASLRWPPSGPRAAGVRSVWALRPGPKAYGLNEAYW
jgi:hypothetical protein